ncbi:DoxX family protein [Pusillimonas sp. MFBS29]|uniref:DoxX family protein n=1 Tax=Pusillimonas sp. MFBS29 TaxID=2886690 RepID=UPI001D121AC1|nr:DoxX family protein [Pusillimonas sp. MFBS29]MCC2597272.1 DoxX family protein [Pusillimonas sp. MFBS29]
MNNSCTVWTPRMLSILRIVAAYCFIWHGTSKYFGFPGKAIEGLQIFSMMGIAGLIELVAGALLIIGLFTRGAAFIASGFCAAAYFIGHVAGKGMLLFPVMNGGEAAVLFCFVFLYIFFAGPGPWSVDAARSKA